MAVDDPTMEQIPSPRWYIEGSIGSGKSSALNLLESRFGVNIFPEPLRKWTHFELEDGKTINLLQRFYEKYIWLYR